MSTITNANVLVGETASSSGTDTKFSDVATATSSIDERNVRYEGLDSVNMTSNFVVVRRGYIDNEVTNATAGIAYSALKAGGANSGVQAVDHVDTTASSTGLLLDFSSFPLTLKDGDLLRIWHSCHLYKHENGNMISGYSSGPPASYIVSPVVMTTFPGIARGPVFGKTGGSLTGWEVFPGWDTAWMNSTDSGSQIKLVNGPASSTNSRSYGLAQYPHHGTKISSSEMRVRYTGGSTLNYLHQGSDTLVYGIRVFMYGPVIYNPITPASSGAASYSFASSTTGAAASVANYYISHGHIGFMQMRGGSV